jgi:hypothetical protein
LDEVLKISSRALNAKVSRGPFLRERTSRIYPIEAIAGDG